MKKAISLLLLLILMTACIGIGRPEPTGIPVPVVTASPTNPIAPPPETISAPTLVIDPTPTSDTRLPPEDWQKWPVVPAVTPRAIQIYQTGLTMGLDPHSFSKVGDCQSIKAAFMGYFDLPDRYSLGTDYAYLQKTIDNFAGHFNTDGQAVRGGFNAAAVLSPLWSDPHACLPGENPLDCELRVSKPIIVIVSLEVWWNGRTPAQYEKLMRQILDDIIAHGAVPILATKADNVEGDNSLNLTTARLAYEYDLPLWNFWAAVQTLPNHGMDLKRNDGFHISTDAWTVRSFTGLQALDSVWNGVLNAAPAAAATPTFNFTATPGSLSTLVQTPFPVVTPAPGTTPIGGPGRIVFGLAKRQGEGYEYLGVYLLDLNSRTTRQIFGADVRFQSASPDGKYLLVSQGSTLYRTNADGSDPLQLTENLYSLGNTGAVWLPDGQIAALLSESGGNVIALMSADGALASELPTDHAIPVELYADSDAGHVYWESGSCTASGVCTRSGAWVTSPDGTLNRALAGVSGPILAPDGKSIVSAVLSTTDQSDLVFASPDGSNPRPYPLPGNQLMDYSWSPSGDAVAAVVAVVSDYSGLVTSNRNFLIDPQTRAISEYSPSRLLHPRLLWSPDGSSLAWIGTLPTDHGFTIGGSLADRRTKQVTDLGAALGQSGADYLAVTNADWLAMP